MDKQLVFHIVESNPNAEVQTPPEEAQYASDKNTRAQGTNPGQAADRPKAEGVDESSEIPKPDIRRSNITEIQQNTGFKKFDLTEIVKGILPKETKKTEEKEAKSASDVSGVPQFQKYNPEELGDFSLNTYAWNFAPYMLRLKRKIQNNIRPPEAFTRFGLIDGMFSIRFTITRAGELKSIEVLESKGSKSLELTSVNAVNFSAPFEPLPKDFPEKELIIIGNFRYYIR